MAQRKGANRRPGKGLSGLRSLPQRLGDDGLSLPVASQESEEREGSFSALGISPMSGPFVHPDMCGGKAHLNLGILKGFGAVTGRAACSARAFCISCRA